MAVPHSTLKKIKYQIRISKNSLDHMQSSYIFIFSYHFKYTNHIIDLTNIFSV